MTELKFSAFGKPMPQGSKTPGMTKDGRLFVRENNTAAHKEWREIVRDACWHAMREVGWQTLTDTPISVTLQFRFDARKAERDEEGTPKITTPDLDKLIRSVLDSLTDAGAWDDDSRVVDIKAVKYYTADSQRKGVVIRVTPMGV